MPRDEMMPVALYEATVVSMSKYFPITTKAGLRSGVLSFIARCQWGSPSERPCKEDILGDGRVPDRIARSQRDEQQNSDLRAGRTARSKRCFHVANMTKSFGVL